MTNQKVGCRFVEHLKTNRVMKKEFSSYEQQAQELLQSTGVMMSVEFVKHDYYFSDDKEYRDIFRISLKKAGVRKKSFLFGQSLNDSTGGGDCPPTAYDVLACLTKYEVGTFEDFCSDFGYDTDSRKAEKTYNTVVKEHAMVCALWNEDELELLREIQ